MNLFDRLFSWRGAVPVTETPPLAFPRAMGMSGDGGIVIRTPQDIEEAIRCGAITTSGATVTPETAMRTATVFGCVRLISGAVATLPLQIKRRIDARTREDASDAPIWRVLNRKPNRWQKPAQFKRMMQAHLLLRGNAYALMTKNGRGEVISLVPLHPDRVELRQLADMSLEFVYTRKDGRRFIFGQNEVMHLVLLTLDGFRGVSVIAYAREVIGLSMAMETHGAALFRNGANVSGALTHKDKLSDEAYQRLKSDMENFRNGGAREGDTIILEEGMEYEKIGLSASDAQWLESRKFSRTDIMMFFGVPPHMLGDTEKATSWGSGIEQQSQGFVTFTLEDHLTMWEEAVNVDCIDFDKTPDLYAKFNRNALVKGDFKSRWEGYTKALQWGVYSPNDVLQLEDQNPREGGDIYYPPPNTAGNSEQDKTNDLAQAA